MTTTLVLSIRKQQQQARKRLGKLFKNELPKNWITLFIHDNPQYKGNNIYFTEVKRAGTNATGGIVPTEKTISDLEAWINKNKITKHKKSN